MSNLIDEVLPQIQIAARRVAAKWPEVVDQDDMVSILTLHFLERPGSLDALATLSVEKRVARLTAIGHEQASAERSSFEVFSGQFRYSVEEVQRLLAKGALGGQVAGFDSAVEDLSRAAADLRESNDRYHELIWQRYVLNKIPERTSKDALTRAIESLTTLMNRRRKTEEYAFTNGGRYRNNRKAQNITELDYSGSTVYDE